ncbi:MAG: DUF4194 domain-containing protein [Candidatus Thiodiazotropha sp. (ex Lucinoma kastoroae)]|nr:DUF4194 domain-containing protein [Candidatus Thiodiazotropha sp. (ex Lucinoma kastoroae)]
MTEAEDTKPDPFPRVIIALMKGVVYEENDPALWQDLFNLQARTRDYISVLELELMLDEAEGYAWLRTRPATEGAPELPRLITRRQLSFPVSLLLALLRKKLVEFDAGGGDSRLILSRDEIVELLRVFLPAGSNEARLIKQIDSHINKIIDSGFIRRLRGTENQFEVRRILKAFVDAQWLTEFDQRLEEYQVAVLEHPPREQ